MSRSLGFRSQGPNSGIDVPARSMSTGTTPPYTFELPRVDTKGGLTRIVVRERRQDVPAKEETESMLACTRNTGYSLLSCCSFLSALCLFCLGSVLSVASVASMLSMSSVLSVGCTTSLLSVYSINSVLSVGCRNGFMQICLSE